MKPYVFRWLLIFSVVGSLGSSPPGGELAHVPGRRRASGYSADPLAVRARLAVASCMRRRAEPGLAELGANHV